jgi:hypothetical protein
MFENEREFRKVVARLEIDAEPNPAHRERLRRQMLATFEATQKAARRVGTAHHLSPARENRCAVHTLLSFSFLKLAIAAAVMLSAAAVFYHFSNPADAIATEIAQTKLAMEKMDWMHVVTTTGEDVEHHWYDMASRRQFLTTAQGTVWCWDNGPAQKQFVYNPKVRTLTIDDLPPGGFQSSGSVFTMLDMIAAKQQEEGATIERRTDTFQGRRVRVYRTETARNERAMSYQRGSAELPVAKIAETFIVDPQTKLMLAGHTEYFGSEGQVVARDTHEIEYPPNGPASMYALGVPTNARIVDRSRQPIGTPGNVPTPIPTPAPAGNSSLVPLEIKLPKAMFIGTPQNVRVPNLEKPRKGPRPPCLAPAGTINLALGRPVVSSDTDPVIGSLDLITDGDKEVADGTFVELGPTPQHITIDLQESCEIYAVVVWHHHRWPRVYFDVVVQVSEDRTFRKGVQTVFNNDTDNSLRLGAGTDMNYTETNEGKLIDCKGVQGRYVRLWSNGNTYDDLNHYIEVEVYGRTVRSMKSD